jgi:hypothetical protein
VTCGGGACATYCADPVNNTISAACDSCVFNVSQTDIDNFVTDCQNDANCVNFVQLIQTCPQ